MNVAVPKRFTVDEYHWLIALVFLTEDDRIGLIGGELLQRAEKGTPHSVCNSILSRQLDRILGDRAVIRSQEPIALPIVRQLLRDGQQVRIDGQRGTIEIL